MAQWRLNILMLCAVLVLGAAACGSDEDTGSQNNGNWDFDNDAGADAAGPDAGGEDVREDTSDQDTTIEPTTPFTAEGLASAPWYGVTALAREPATTGSMLQVEFNEDMTATLGFHGEVTGRWDFFGDNRVRLFDLMNGEAPNQPQQLLLDADLDGDELEGLEIVIPDAEGGTPYLLRFEQLATPAISADDIEGSWQSDETFTGENGGEYRLAMRFIGGTVGYGGYNGAYIEFISGDLELITYDTGETFWFSVPPAGGNANAVPSLAGEVREDGEGGFTIYTPREVTPQSGEFESLQMQHVEAFTNP